MNNKTINEFLNRLEGKEGCNFRLNDRNDKNSITFDCDGRTRTKAIAILEGMKVSQHEIDEIMDICEENGGYCDCEILFNAEEALLERYNK